MQKRKRVPVACEECRRRRIRCDANVPFCDNCTSRGTICTYVEVLFTDVAQSELATLLNRLGKLEESMKRLHCSTQGQIKSSFSNNGLGDAAQGDTMPRGLIFFHKLRILKAYIVSHQSTACQPNIFLAILNQSEISMLSKRLGDALLGQHLEEVSSSFESAANGLTEQFLNSLIDLDADSTYLSRCIEIYLKLETPFIHLLLDPLEVQKSDWLLLPGLIRKSISAALLILGSVILRTSSDFEDFTITMIRSQELSAYHQAIRVLNSYRFIQPSFLEFKVSVLLLWLLYTYSSVPSVLHFMPHIIEMANVLRVNNSEVNKSFTSPEADIRCYVWFFIVNFQYLIAISGSTEPLISQPYIEIPPSFSLVYPDDALRTLKYTAEIHHIFDEVHHLFLVPNQQFNFNDKLLDKLPAVDAKLRAWRSNIPEVIWQDKPSSSEERLCRYFIPFSSELLKVKYYHIIIAIYSISLFASVSLSNSFQEDLETFSDAARTLLSLALFSGESKDVCGIMENNGITSAVYCLCLKQLVYSGQASNYKDILTLQRNLGRYSNRSWSYLGCKFPPTIIWEFLIDVTSHYSYDVNTSALGNKYRCQEFNKTKQMDSLCVII